MQIIDNRKPNTVPFHQVKVGQIFFDEDLEQFCIKIEPLNEVSTCTSINAISLEKGEAHLFNDNEMVEMVRATLQVSNA